VTSPVCEEGCMCLPSVKYEFTPASPLNALRCTGSEFPNHPIYVFSSCYPSKVINEGQASDTLEALFH